jgi:hypothetical protein
MQEPDKPLPPAATPEEIADYELRLRKLIQKLAKHDADFAALKENIDERLPSKTVE